MRIQLAVLIVTICLPAAARAQAPNLTRQQRDLLQAIVTAVDAAGAQPELDDAHWRSHVMRASDGSHYVAFTVSPPPGVSFPQGPALLYIRVATATPQGATRVVERSAIRDWLAGGRTDPRLLPKRGIAIGDMPVMGATGTMGSQRQPISTGVNEMRLMALERERAKQKQEDDEKQRRAELEGKAAVTRQLFPFEDFDLASHSASADGARIITRAFTAGPGDYDLFIGWADPAGRKPESTVAVIRKSLHLPPASADALTTSSIILADDVRLRPAPYPSAEQAAHPYSIGVTEVTPAADAEFANSEFLNVFFQVINPRPSDDGKPDIEIASRIVRLERDREQPVASLTPLTYSAASMPSDFDLRLGHPVLAALSAPLATLWRGSYRLKIVVNDRIGGRSTQSDVDFSVRATPASLLKEAPPMAAPFDRQSVLRKEPLSYLVQSLRPGAPSPALRRALDTAAAGKFIDLMVEEPVAKGEEGVRAVLTGLSQLSIGDASAAVQFQRGVLLGAAVAPARVLSGAARAMQGRDLDAIAGWLDALKAGAPREIVAPLLLEAYIRRADYSRAATLVSESKTIADNRSWTLGLAALDIAQKNETAALARLDAFLAAHPDDSDAVWLRLHALYAQVVAGHATARARFETQARAYIDSKGTHAAIAEEWLLAIS